MINKVGANISYLVFCMFLIYYSEFYTEARKNA